MRQAGGLLSHPDALQVNGKEHPFLVRELLVPGDDPLTARGVYHAQNVVDIRLELA